MQLTRTRERVIDAVEEKTIDERRKRHRSQEQETVSNEDVCAKYVDFEREQGLFQF